MKKIDNLCSNDVCKIDKQHHTKKIWMIVWLLLFPAIYLSGRVLLEAFDMEPAIAEPPLADFMVAMFYVFICWFVNLLLGVYGIKSLPQHVVFMPRAWWLNRSVDRLGTWVFKVMVYGLTLYNGGHFLRHLVHQDWPHAGFALSFIVLLNLWAFLVGTVNLNRKEAHV